MNANKPLFERISWFGAVGGFVALLASPALAAVAGSAPAMSGVKEILVQPVRMGRTSISADSTYCALARGEIDTTFLIIFLRQIQPRQTIAQTAGHFPRKCLVQGLRLKIAPSGKSNIGSLSQTVMRRIQRHPPVVDPCLHPGMSGAFSRHQSGDIQGRN